MSVSNLHAEHSEQLRSYLEQGLRFNPESLLRLELGPLGFKDAQREIDSISNLLRRLSQVDLAPMPFQHVEQAGHAVNSTLSAFKAVMDFNVTVPNPSEQRDLLIDKLRENHRRLFEATATYLPYLEEDLTSYERARAEHLSNMRKAFDEVNGMRQQAQQALDSVRKVATSTGVAAEADHFRKQALEHKVAARIWAGATGVLMLSTGGAAFYSAYLIFQMTQPLGTPLAIQLAIGKLVFFSVMFTAIVGSTRSYRSNRHNYVVNQHRANALSTFQAFAQGASEDKDTKRAVLLQATTCVFSPQPTSYGSKEIDSVGSQPIVDLAIKALTSPGSRQ